MSPIKTYNFRNVGSNYFSRTLIAESGRLGRGMEGPHFGGLMKMLGRNRFTHVLPFLVLLAPAVKRLEAQTDQTATTISAPLDVKDSYTGKAVPNAVVRGQIVANVAPDNLQVLGKFDRDGKLVLPVVADETYAAEISAPGYKTVRTTIGEASGQPPTTEGFNLEPFSKPAAMVQAEAQTEPGHDILIGYVLDSVHSAGIANATIHLEKGDFTTTTDAEGFFFLKFPVSLHANPSKTPTSEDDFDLETLIISAPGYKRYVRDKIELIYDNAGGGSFSLVKGGGEIKEVLPLPGVGTGTGVDPDGEAEPDETAEPYSPSLENWLDRREIKKSSPEVQASGAQGSDVEASQVSSISTTVPLPDVIYVGSGCKRTAQAAGVKPHYVWSCATSIPYPLEEYVAKGLGDEWPLSGSPDSLAAGAAAYRSYAVWYKSHPLSEVPKIDICDTTLCQVFKDKFLTPKKTQAAASTTAGVVLSADGAHAIKAEYAAETNGLAVPKGGCPDGQTGQVNNLATGKPLPANQAWPCMPDALSQGAQAQPITNRRTGAVMPETDHGRGMSQRGSERWATGKNPQGIKVTQTTPWQCILDHYYNDNGNGTGSRSGARSSYLENGTGDGLIAAALSTYDLDGSVHQAQLAGDVGNGFWSPSQRYFLGQNEGSGNFQLTNLQTGAATTLPPDLDIVWLSWSPAGNTLNNSQGLVAFNSSGSSFNGISDISTMTSDGQNITQVTHGQSTNIFYIQPSFSPDGKRIVAAASGGPIDPSFTLLVTMNVDGSGMTFLPAFTNTQAVCKYPAWSPDGRTIITACQTSYSGGTNDYFTVAADGSAVPQQLTHLAIPAAGLGPLLTAQYTQDGRQIVFGVVDSSGNVVLNKMNADGSGLQSIANVPSARYGYAIPQVTRCRRFDTF